MDRAAELVQLTLDLDTAAGREDWPAALRVEQALARRLPAMAAAGAWTAAERRALDRLSATRSRVQRHCADAAAQLERHLTSLHEHREGWLAYAGSAPEDVA